VPIKFLKTILPKGENFNKNYKGKTNIGNIISGIKNGKKRVIYIYNVCDHQKVFKQAGGNAIGYTTAVATVVCAKLVLENKWNGVGVKTPEDKSLDSKIFLKEMTKIGLPWTIEELKKMPKQLDKNY